MDLQPASVKVGGGVGADDQTEAVQRRFEVLYLDESARVVRFLPDADSDSEPQLFVFEREGAESLMEEVRSPCRPLCQRELPSSAQYAYWLGGLLCFALCETKAKGPFWCAASDGHRINDEGPIGVAGRGRGWRG